MTDIRVASAGQFGAACLEALMAAVEGHDRPVVGLPTGNTPTALFTELRAAVAEGRCDISAWRPFAIDEYGGARDHPCSSRAYFQRYWDTIPGAPPVEQFDPEARDIPRECARMAAALEQAGGLTVSVLGVGMNGHLAFNEPGGGRNSVARRVDLHEASMQSARACWGAATPAWGLTLGLSELLSAGSVVVMANGLAKAEIVARALQGPITPGCPASLTRGFPHAPWVLDEQAANRLR